MNVLTKNETAEQDRHGPLPPASWVRWCLRADPWPLSLLTVILALGYFWVYRSPTVAMVGLAYCDDFFFGSFLFGLLAAGRGVQLLLRNACEARFGVIPGAFRSRRWFWPWLLLIGAGTVWMVWSQVPMYAAFQLSRAALDGIADEALADPANAHLLEGRWAGLYRIAGAEVIGKTVVLYLGEDRGSYGFARVPGARTDVIFNQPGSEDNVHNHLEFPQSDGPRDPVGRRIGDDWFAVYSGYWLTKVGWS
jgi:hypothetical protein